MTKPYEELASIYDQVMHHVHYRRWAGYIERLFGLSNTPITKLIDLSCGTGKHLRSLKKKGRELYGSDLSLSMLNAARGNTKKKVPLICADFSKVPFKEGCFDAALILYDSINYVIADDMINQVFAQVNYLLKDNGIFIFDVVTPFACEEYFLNYTETEIIKGVEMYRHSWYQSDQQLQFNEFVIKNGGEEFTELHRQKIRKIDEWKRIIRENNFELIQAFNNFTFIEATPYSERIHFVCRV
jgi:ubiquinone/menaquinone biosynthesis C-methylase UbiE